MGEIDWLILDALADDMKDFTSIARHLAYCKITMENDAVKKRIVFLWEKGFIEIAYPEHMTICDADSDFSWFGMSPKGRNNWGNYARDIKSIANHPI